MMRKVIYTCIVGNYDILRQPLAVEGDWDFVCFSDTLEQGRYGAWEIRSLPWNGSSPVLESRYPKLLPHKVLDDYDYSLWMDANLVISGKELFDCADRLIGNDVKVAQVPHPLRDCVYQEIKASSSMSRMGLGEAIRLIAKLKREGFPEHWGLFENNIILRRHGDPLVVEMDEQWWEEFSSMPSRDQASLMPVYWRHSYSPSLLLGPGKCSRNVDFIDYHTHTSWKESFIRRKWKGIRRRVLDFFWKLNG